MATENGAAEKLVVDEPTPPVSGETSADARRAERAPDPPAQASKGDASEPLGAGRIDAQRRLMIFLVIMLGVFFVGVLGSTIYEYVSYTSGLDALQRSCTDPDCFPEHGKMFAAMRPFLSFVTARNLAVYMSFVIILVGCAFILAVPEGSPFKLGVSRNGAEGGTGYSGNLQTSSPGLVLVAIGALLVVATLYRQGTPTYTPSPSFRAKPAPTLASPAASASAPAP
ncbi:MAG: hypothetical protein QM820_06845 [Minicystis sp.]